jgi:triacylglycerol lipase
MATTGSASPVVLVPGIFDTAAAYRRMAPTLQEAGHDTHAISLEPGTGRLGLDVLASQLHQFVEERIGPEAPFHLVGFSMGGLVARYYLKRLGGAARVRRFVSISSPHHGSYSACLLPNAACRQMRPGSSFLAELNRDWVLLAPVSCLSLWTPFDLSIIPPRSAVMPVGDVVRVPVAAHPFMINDRRCIRYVREFLGGG